MDRPNSVSDVSLLIRRCRRAGETSLSLSGLGLAKIPEDVFRLDKITRLELAKNGIVSLDERIAQCESLEELDLSNNRMVQVPINALLQLPKLRTLRLDGNPLVAPFDTLLSFDGSARTALQAIGGARSVLSPTSATESLPRSSFAAQQATRRQTESHATAQSIDDVLAVRDEGSAAWRKERQSLLEEIEKLRAKLAKQEAPKAPGWLGSSQTVQLPSQREEMHSAQAEERLRAELLDEQRKNQRLQNELLKVEERLKESAISGGMAKGDVMYLSGFDEVIIGEQISQGGFAVVARARWQHLDCAVKRIVDPVITDELKEDFDTEVQMLTMIRHPRILLLLAVCRQPPHLGFVTEYISGGTLYEYLHRRLPSGASEAAEAPRAAIQRMLLQVAEGLAYLHFLSVVHRDIKSMNVLLTQARDVKLCDFGLARRKSDLCTGRMQFAGTPSYMAPELLRKQSYSEKVDTFAYGAMLFEAFMLQVPFDGLEGPDIADKWESGFVPRVSNALPKDLRALIASTWNAQPSQRISMAEVVETLRGLVL